MDRKYVERYRRLHERHWWWRAREEEILRILDDLRPSGGFGPILDVGCGDGLFLEALEAYGEPRGVEVDLAAVGEESLRGGRIHVGPFDESYRTEARFGLILMLDVIEHLDDDVGALRRAGELLRPGGRILVTVPALPRLWTGHDDWNHHRRRYTRRSLREAVARAGLSAPDVAYFFHWLVPLKLVVRALERLRRTPPEPAEVPPAPVNALARRISALENRIFRRRRLPLGTSLRAVVVRPEEAPAAFPDRASGG